MFDPSGISLWHVVGFAARIAIALNLHRRVDDASLLASFVEHRKRVFYSLYNLDRLVATTLSKPLAISDDDIDNEVSLSYFAYVYIQLTSYSVPLSPSE